VRVVVKAAGRAWPSAELLYDPSSREEEQLQVLKKAQTWG
jgi:hypothetical protein